jgi:hypothetical protein
LKEHKPWFNQEYSELFMNEQTPWPLLRKRTTPTERPPLADEI